MKTIHIFLLIFHSFSTLAASPMDACGEYRAKGEIVKNPNEAGYSLLVNPKTKSEFQFKIKLRDELKASSFFTQRVEATFLVAKKMNGMKGEIEKMISIKKIPAKSIGIDTKNEIELIKKSDCIK